jgi:hypothetical protein
MSPDTINMALNIIAIAGWVIVGYLVLRNRAEIAASKAAVNGLPKAIMPAQEPLLKAVSGLMDEAHRLTVLLREDANRMAENAELRRQSGVLEHKIGISEGEKVVLNDMASRQSGVINSQSAQISKLLVAIQEQTAVTNRQQALIEELTRTLDARAK